MVLAQRFARYARPRMDGFVGAVATIAGLAIQIATGATDLSTAVLGTGLIVAAFFARDHNVRLLFVAVAVVVLGHGGWLDFEGWRFLPRGPFSGSP